MTRRLAVFTSCLLVLAFTVTTLGQGRGRDSAPPSGGSEKRAAPPGGRESSGGGRQGRPDVQAARERLDKDARDSKRLQNEIKVAKDHKDRDKVQLLTQELKLVQEKIKQDKENIKRLQKN